MMVKGMRQGEGYDGTQHAGQRGRGELVDS